MSISNSTDFALGQIVWYGGNMYKVAGGGPGMPLMLDKALPDRIEVWPEGGGISFTEDELSGVGRQMQISFIHTAMIDHQTTIRGLQKEVERLEALRL